MDRVSDGANSGYKWPSECSNGFSKRILEESLASITPYFRQASMKRAARSKCLILPRRQKEEEKGTDRRRRWELLSETSTIPASMLKHTSTLSSWCHSYSLREHLSPEVSHNTSCQGGGEGDQQPIDAAVKNTGSDHTLWSVLRRARGEKETRGLRLKCWWVWMKQHWSKGDEGQAV